MTSEIERLFDQVKPFTYLDLERLNSLRQICQYINASDIPGDIVECGTYKGGAAAVLSRYMGDRHLWLYDSFQGMPQTTEQDGTEAAKWVGDCLASPEDLKEVMQLVGTAPNQFTIKSGWFHETFQEENLPPKIALLHCDADWYDSVTLVLDTLYSRVMDGGCIVLDDFGYWEGCREAFYDFCYRWEEKPLIERVGSTQAYWFKGFSHNRTGFLVPQIPGHHSPLAVSAQHGSSPNSDQSSHSQALEQQVQELQQRVENLELKSSDNFQFLRKKIKGQRTKLRNSRVQLRDLRNEIEEYKEKLVAFQNQVIAYSPTFQSIAIRLWQRTQVITNRLDPFTPKSIIQQQSTGSKNLLCTDLSEQMSQASTPIPLSPLTQSSDVIRIKTYSATRLIHDWKHGFGIDITSELQGIKDIQLFQCNQSKLCFFYPFNVFGSENLYAQLEKLDWYYMPEKWEYSVARRDIRPSSTVLEIGSGYGFFLEYCQPYGIQVKGLETNSKAVANANDRQLDVENADLIDFAKYHSKAFDIVCSFQVLEHVPNPLQFLEAAIRVLKPGGSLILGVPNANSFLKYQYCLLDMPPHHMHQWSTQTFKYLEKLFPLKLESIKYEPLASYHISGYVQSIGHHLEATLPFGKMAFNSRVLSLYEKMLQNPVLRSCFRGQSLYVRFRKI
ncbi:MAG: methyltransferase domain-containing protein [Cyanothece sp. SIO2G6]|nr:methyltransferase domain-containing protein [Cyanothece sp. SIO2G6]